MGVQEVKRLLGSRTDCMQDLGAGSWGPDSKAMRRASSEGRWQDSLAGVSAVLGLRPWEVYAGVCGNVGGEACTKSPTSTESEGTSDQGLPFTGLHLHVGTDHL